MVKWISQLTSDQLFWVRILVGALEKRISGVVSCRAERVWFSGRTTGCQSVDASSILATRTKRDYKTTFEGVQKSVDSGDKGHATFVGVREIVRE